VGSDQVDIDRLMTETDRMIRMSLANSPADPFLWMVDFWFAKYPKWLQSQPSEITCKCHTYQGLTKDGLLSTHRFAVALFPGLPPDIAESTISEFARLVDSGFINESGGYSWSAGLVGS